MIQAPPVVGGSEEEGVTQAPPAVVVESEGESCEEEGVGHTPPAVECVAEGATFGVMLGVGAGVRVL